MRQVDVCDKNKYKHLSVSTNQIYQTECKPLFVTALS